MHDTGAAQPTPANRAGHAPTMAAMRRLDEDTLATMSIRSLIAELAACEEELRTAPERAPAPGRPSLIRHRHRLVAALRRKHG